MTVKRLVVVAMTIIALTLGTGATAQAAVVEQTAPRAAVGAELSEEQQEVLALRPFVSEHAGSVVLDRAAALAAGRDARVVTEFAAGIDQAQRLETAASRVGTTSARCPGLTDGPYYRSFSYSMWLDACDARSIAAVAAAGGSVATIAGAIITATGVGAPIGAIVAIAGGVASLGGAVLSYSNRYGRGVVVRSYGWCSSQ